MKIGNSFFGEDALTVAPELLGKMLVRRFEDGHIEKKRIIEVEAYRGEEDLASHARRGKTKRTEVMYGEGGRIYVYLIYGMYWMLNIVTGKRDEPQAVLIRSVEGIKGPGRVGKWLKLNSSFYGEDLTISGRLWIEPGKKIENMTQTTRIGIDYAGDWAKREWRWVAIK